jgi:hypothetical protein
MKPVPAGDRHWTASAITLHPSGRSVLLIGHVKSGLLLYPGVSLGKSAAGLVVVGFGCWHRSALRGAPTGEGAGGTAGVLVW